MSRGKCIHILLLIFVIVFLVGCSSVVEKEKIKIENFQTDRLSEITYEEIVVSYPSYSSEDSSGWIALEDENDEALYFHFLYGTFSVFCREPNVDVTELNVTDRTIFTTDYSEPQKIRYKHSTWEVQTFDLHSGDDGLEGFLATSFYNGKKYFIFASMNDGYDMYSDFERVMNEIYFKEDLSMYYDSDFDINGNYPLVTISDIRSGAYNKQVVAVDAVLGQYASYELQDAENTLAVIKGETDKVITSRTIRFDTWFVDGDDFLCEEDWIIHESDYTEWFITQFDNIDDGDVVRLYFYVLYNTPDTLKWAELLEKSTLEEKQIEYPVVVEPEPAETLEAPQPTEEFRAERAVYITNSGSKYHTATCRWVSDSCIEISYEDAIARGYKPCGTCNPRS